MKLIHDRTRALLVVLTLVAVASHVHAVGGNTTLKKHKTEPLDSGEITAMLDILKKVDPEAAEAIRHQKENGLLGFGRITSGNKEVLAAHDRSTIGVNLRKEANGQVKGEYEPWICALSLAHEWEHITHIPPGSGPEVTDPTTADDNPCGPCNHVLMGVKDMQRMAELSCKDDLRPPCTQFCDRWCETIKTGRDNHARCRRSTCTGIDIGLTFDSNITTPPCCSCSCN